MLTRRALNRALLARQLLLERSAMGPLDAIEHLVGLQAQSPNPPYVGLWSRLAQFELGELTGLLESRQAVRVALMRSSVHLVSARDAVAIRPLVQAAQYGGLPGFDLAEVARLTREHLADRPLTLGELGTLLAQRWPDLKANALGASARVAVPLVQVPPSGLWGAVGQPVYTAMESWLGDQPAAPSMTVADLITLYLTAFGPATVDDMEAWSGLTHLHEVTELLGDRLVTHRGEDGDELFDLPDAPLPDPETPAPGRFIADFDNILLAHDDPSRIMTQEQYRTIFKTPGLIPGTVLVDGFVRAIWKITWLKGAATLVVRPFSQIPTVDRSELIEEGYRLLAFAAADATAHDVRFNSGDRDR
ncbi:hypothetical protein F4553_007374 [Allocatelliglobosispora scoriae]|uniref:Winged helix DNA-binding domain-containing protein n=1 Tax=Allocatelliglobosispora scoriae TaxID=643052 RepID=A0A841C4P7_9ACTN|nr:winged helix DNA-binding domain-containing protein [Allocatelliglobosispora scoriae]MBB5873940.1 hypothetical protein [Allocatelliglobosispora scoriae]